METSAIAYRVADFLGQHPPFQTIDPADLRQLAASGRVRFFEANEFIHWQGEPHKPYVYVIQQGTVSLWDDGKDGAALRDMRGAGDLLGIERYANAPFCLYSATSASDVVIYAFPDSDFERIVLARPEARQFVEAYDTVSGLSQESSDHRNPQDAALRDLLAGRRLETCGPQSSIKDVARLLSDTGCDAIAVVDEQRRFLGAVGPESIVAWVAAGGVDTAQPVANLLPHSILTMREDDSVANGAIGVGDHAPAAVGVTTDGSPGSQLRGVLTPRDIGRAFGDEPASILREIRFASGTNELRSLNHRARALALRQLNDSSSVAWVGRFVARADAQILRRVIALEGGDTLGACWCICGAAGRGESFTLYTPQLLLLTDAGAAGAEHLAQYTRVTQALGDCGYLARNESPFEASFHVAGAGEWAARYAAWLSEPVRTAMHRARQLFDLRIVEGSAAPWVEVERAVDAAVDPTLLLVLANDCLASLPPLTFFQDAVLDTAGEQTTVFKLEESALRPLVDVGRVFGLAARRVAGTSTVERLELAAAMHPDHELVFREAAETFRILIRQQARIGIMQGSIGSEIPPSLLSRHERHVLRSGFRSILTLLEFTRSAFWLESV